MKNFKLSSLLLLFGLFFQHQSEAQTLNTTIYFESGQHSLTEDSKAVLAQFLAEIKNLKDYDLDLKAYTDDLGTMDYNDKLAARRADEVKKYLDEYGIKPAFSEIEKVGELTLNEGVNVQEQRRKNRRVDIEVTVFKPHNLEDMYGYFLNRKVGKEVIDVTQDNVIFGSKGTEVYIPKNSLQLVGGGEVDFNKVQITLQEAYDNTAMILHNLTTTSNGELIETAGMIYLDAKTLDGRTVEVKPDAELMVAMPSPAVLPNDMQLFTADRTAQNASENINWIAQGQGFLSTNFNKNVPSFNFEEVNFNLLPTVGFPNINKWPEKIAKPKEPVKPWLQPERETVAPSLEEIKAKNPPYENESNRKYAERMESTYQAAKKQCEANIQYNATAQKRDEKQMQEYALAQEKYEKEMVGYRRYETEVENIKQELLEKKEDLQKWFKSIVWAENGFETEMILMLRSYQQFLKLKAFLEFECKRLDMEEELAVVKNAELKQANLIMLLGTKFLNCARLNKEFDKSHGILSTATIVDEMISDTSYLNFGLFDSEAGDKNVEFIYKKIIGLYREATIQNEVVENYNEILKLSDFTANARKLDSLCLAFTKIQEKVLKEKIERGWMNTAEVQQEFSNMVAVNRLGWINCDRFINRRGESIELTVRDEILAAHDNKSPLTMPTHYYAIFKSVRGIINFNPSDTKQGVLIVGGVPKDEKVKIVGVRVVGEQVEVGIYEGTAKDIQNLQLSFSPKNIQQLRHLL